MVVTDFPLRAVVQRISDNDPPWYYEQVVEILECGHSHETWGSRPPAKRRRCWACATGLQDELRDLQRINMEWDAFRNEQ